MNRNIENKNRSFQSTFIFTSMAAIGSLFLMAKTYNFFNAIYPLMMPKCNLLKKYGKNSWVAITGSSDGLGKQFAYEFSNYGFNCLLIARNELKTRKVEAELKKFFPNISYKIVLADFKNVLDENFFQNIEKEIKLLNVKILINNVGITHVSNFVNSTEMEIREIIFINSYSTVLLSKLFINQINNTNEKIQKYAIINVGSILGNIPLPYLSIYCATKAFINNFSESLYYEFQEKNIDIFCLTPYYVSTKMTGFKKLALDTITTEECVKSAIKQFSYGKKTSSGNWKHEIINLLLENNVFREVLIERKKKFYKNLIDRAEKIKQKRQKRSNNADK